MWEFTQVGGFVCAKGGITDHSKTHISHWQMTFGFEAVAVATFSPRSVGHTRQHLQDIVLVSSSDEELAPEGRQGSTNSCHRDSSIAANQVTSGS